ncbi:preprotein translocase subunit SecG [Alteraurantiacibacter aquimixticola]|uniref:Protein-export membrane protein SecG n=1 Tax=Alteraurantiacibacter aquimixticola TaxID=2489173 RepID=A0A4T3EZF0_9SPHN|nr:preprotein translocase subunit SecG [Alteraurantiacibacter aquimixticola]TIX50139.1 preprotein translocase subunit SecG [Alteraurantiacibacter aquimixticola]
MSLFLFLTVVQAIVAFALVCVVLMQRSEGGGLGIGGGGSPGGLMSARGAADFLTRTTKWLAVLFVTLSIALAAVAINATSGREIDQSLDRSVTMPAETGEGLFPADAEGEAGEEAPATDDALSGVAE